MAGTLCVAGAVVAGSSAWAAQTAAEKAPWDTTIGDKKVKEAEEFAQQDKKKKENIEVKNNADQMIYQTEKLMKDLEGKISDDEKKDIEAKLADLKKASEGSDYDDMKKKTEDLTQAFYKVSEQLYKQSAEAGAAGAEAGAQGYEEHKGDDDVVDGDYEVVDEDDK